MEEKNNSQNLLEEEKQNKSEDSNSLIKSKDFDLEKEFDLTLGTFEEAEKFMQDNEYIREGYILNCNTFKRTLRSLLMIHNETVNVWSHLVGAIFFFFLIWYTTIFITNLQTQVSNIRSDASLVANKAREFKEESSDIMKNVYTSMKEIEYNFKNFYNAE